MRSLGMLPGLRQAILGPVTTKSFGRGSRRTDTSNFTFGPKPRRRERSGNADQDSRQKNEGAPKHDLQHG